MVEIWKDIKNFDYYEISNLGRVRSKKFYSVAACNSKRLIGGKMLRLNVGSWKYFYVSIGLLDQRKKVLVHRIVAENFIDNPYNYPMVNHKDGNKLNNRVDNLEWCTYAMNNLHRCRVLGFGARDKHHNAKLSLEDVRKIKFLSEASMHNTEIASIFNVSRTSISRIVRGKTWHELQLSI